MCRQAAVREDLHMTSVRIGFLIACALLLVSCGGQPGDGTLPPPAKPGTAARIQVTGQEPGPAETAGGTGQTGRPAQTAGKPAQTAGKPAQTAPDGCRDETSCRVTVTVRFDTAGGSEVAPVTVEAGTVLAAPVSEKTGYRLSWSYDFSEPVTADMTVTARWLPRTDTAYRVEHWLENAEDDGYTLEAAEDLTGTTGETVTAGIRSFAHFGCPGETAGTVAPDGSLVLRAFYPRLRTRILFRTDGGDEASAPMTVKYGQTVTLPQPAGKTGYRCRWSIAGAGDGTAVTDGIWLSDAETMTLVAVLLPDSFTVTLDPAGGETGTSTLTVTFGQPYRLPVPVRTGYTFLGWTCGDEAVEGSGTWQIPQSCRLVAVWQADCYRVTLDAAGGTLKEAWLDMIFGAAYVLPVPERAGYRFLGWVCEGVRLDAEGVWLLPYDVTLRAEWEPLPAGA